MNFDGEVPMALSGERLDRVVAMVTGCSRSEAVDWIEKGLIGLDGATATARSARVTAATHLVIDVPDVIERGPAADPAVEYAVVAVDEALIVVDKPAGLVVHPGPGHPDGTLVNGLLARYPEIAGVGEPARPGIVHRLDRGTSGLLVVARTTAAYDSLVAALAAHDVQRIYEAAVLGHLENDRGVVDAPIGRSSRHPTLMAVSATGRPARTRYEVVERYDVPVPLTRIRCELETGRTHQIRVHLAAIGHPVLGDVSYGGRRAEVRIDRPFLHAQALGFVHPASGLDVRYTSPIPDDLQAVQSGFR